MSKSDGKGGHEEPSLWTRARYRFDAILSHGTAGLLFLSPVLVLLARVMLQASRQPGLFAVIQSEGKIIFITEDDETAIPATTPVTGERTSISGFAALRARHKGEYWLCTDWVPTIPGELTALAVLDDADVPGRTYVVIPSSPDEGASDMNTLLPLLHVRDIIECNCDHDNEPLSCRNF